MEIDELEAIDATEIAARIRRKEVSPVEVVEAHLRRIDAVDPDLNAFAFVTGDIAMDMARRAERAVTQGDELGPLHGVPIAFKDLTPTAGVETTSGSRTMAGNVPDHDAIVVERAFKAGAVLIGKTQCSEMAHSPYGSNPLHGMTYNPWDRSRTPGGSSGGSGVAVAAAMVPAAEGNDGGGSIRIPASCCGTYGLKPQQGRIPVEMLETYFETIVTLGPMTWTVRDAALLLSVWAGPDDRDPMSLPDTGDDYLEALAADVAGKRIAFSRNLGMAHDPVIADAVEAAAWRFEDLGCTVEAVDIGDQSQLVERFSPIWWSLCGTFFAGLLDQHRHEMASGLVEEIEKGMAMSASDYWEAEVGRSRWCDQLREVFAGYDALVCPTMSISPPTVQAYTYGPEMIDGTQVDRKLGWSMAYPFNLSTHPAASIPVGFDPDGLPVGMQIVGQRFREDVVLSLSARFEEAFPWQGRRPPVGPEAPGPATDGGE